MRILHVFDHSLPLQSGYVYRSLGILGVQRAFGWDTAHLTSPRFNRGEAAVESVDGWEFYRTPAPRGAAAAWPLAREVLEMRALLRRTRELIEAFAPDIVHAHSPALVGLPAGRAAARLGVPFVYEVRALWEDAAVTQGKAREWGPYYRLVRRLESAVLRRAALPGGKVRWWRTPAAPAASAGRPGGDPDLAGRWGFGGRRCSGSSGP